MKLKLNKSNIKNLSQNARIPSNATPAIGGGWNLDNTPTKYIQTCGRFTLDWQYSCGIGGDAEMTCSEPA
ncbi:hypothetical protein ACSLBF_10985 [Pseudoalteromonas sp. T1lg65]|uniref:hypothetical protein n=1 Tax=Pseudoalteromonas sp. T1lg65 TaxID=2077101 RepID=UPI003F7A0B85